MPDTFIPVKITASNPARGSGTQDNATFVGQSMNASFAWGSSPGTATIVYVGDNAPIATGAYIELELGGHFFAGICKSDVRNQGSHEGIIRTLQFMDLREYLTWDWSFCCFNRADIRLVNGVRQKRYKHIYPSDYDAYIWTFTDDPLDAATILDAIFAGPTIQTDWTYDFTGQGLFPDGLFNVPFFEFDCLNGKRLDAVLNDACERSGCVFGLISSSGTPYNLVFTRKGYGTLPAPPYNSDNRRAGLALSGHPTQIAVSGDRNQYQVMDIEMQPDWSSAWEQFIVFEVFADSVFHLFDYDSLDGDVEGYVGRQQATARALSITVREYAAVAGAQFADNRKYAGRWRMDMPAALYISSLLFRAFRPSDDFSFTNYGNLDVPLTALDIADRLLCKVSQADPTDGTMQFDINQPTDGNGYAMALGYMVGADLFKTIRSDQFTLDFFGNPQVWQHIPFQIDDSGEGVRFIIFDEPVIICENLVLDVDGHKVINAAAGLQVPEVRAALVFEAERFLSSIGVAGKTAVENVAGLNLEMVLQSGEYTEVLYSNGESAFTKALTIGNSLLLRQWAYNEGGFKNIWVPGTDITEFGYNLSSMIDRVQITTSPREGTFEIVDYTNERQRDFFEPERELDRRTQTNSLFPGQSELRTQAEYARKLAAAFKQMPGIRRALSDLISGAIGSDQPLGVTWFDGDTSSLGLMPAGTVIRKSPTVMGDPNTNTIATNPEDITSDDNIFMGVTLRENQNASMPFKIQSTGVALCRVQGPVNAGDKLGLAGDEATGWEYLVVNGSPPVGTALQDSTDDGIVLIQVDLGAPGAGAAKTYVLLAVQDDYLVCHSCDPDGSNEGTDAVYIAKEALHRNSLTSETIYGVEQTYEYAEDPDDGTDWEESGLGGIGNVIRTATDTDTEDTEDQAITPPWRLGEIIMAIPANTGLAADTGEFDDSDNPITVPITLHIFGRSCEWMAI